MVKTLITKSWLIITLILVPLCIPAPGYAQDTTDQIRKLKSAFLFNFLRYSEITSDDAAHLRLCLHGDEAKAVGKYLDEIKGTSIGSKTVTIKTLTTLNAVSDCDVIYYENNPSLKVSTKALTVSSETSLATIQFATINDTLQFEVDLHDAKTKGIYLSSQLLRVAYKVN